MTTGKKLMATFRLLNTSKKNSKIALESSKVALRKQNSLQILHLSSN
jgi:hypothetical protein